MKKIIPIVLIAAFALIAFDKIALAKKAPSVFDQRKAEIMKTAKAQQDCLHHAKTLAELSACAQQNTAAYNPMQQMEDRFAANFKANKIKVLRNMNNNITNMQQNIKRMEAERDCAKKAKDVAQFKTCGPNIIMMAGMYMGGPMAMPMPMHRK